MLNNFVPYNESQQLKELGFSENCLAYYQDWNTKKLLPVDTDFENFRFVSTFLIKSPLFQQAFKFFREKYQYYHNIWNYQHGEPTDLLPSGFTFSIDENWICIIGKDSETKLFDRYYDTYEEAELACLQQLIKLATCNEL